MGFPGVLKKKHEESPGGSIKKEVEILGVSKKKTNAEFPFFEFLRGVTKICRISRGKSFFSPKFLGVK